MLQNSESNEDIVHKVKFSFGCQPTDQHFCKNLTSKYSPESKIFARRSDNTFEVLLWGKVFFDGYNFCVVHVRKEYELVEEFVRYYMSRFFF